MVVAEGGNPSPSPRPSPCPPAVEVGDVAVSVCCRCDVVGFGADPPPE